MILIREFDKLALSPIANFHYVWYASCSVVIFYSRATNQFKPYMDETTIPATPVAEETVVPTPVVETPEVAGESETKAETPKVA